MILLTGINGQFGLNVAHIVEVRPGPEGDGAWITLADGSNRRSKESFSTVMDYIETEDLRAVVNDAVGGGDSNTVVEGLYNIVDLLDKLLEKLNPE